MMRGITNVPDAGPWFLSCSPSAAWSRGVPARIKLHLEARRSDGPRILWPLDQGRAVIHRLSGEWRRQVGRRDLRIVPGFCWLQSANAAGPVMVLLGKKLPRTEA